MPIYNARYPIWAAAIGISVGWHLVPAWTRRACAVSAACTQTCDLFVRKSPLSPFPSSKLATNPIGIAGRGYLMEMGTQVVWFPSCLRPLQCPITTHARSLPWEFPNVQQAAPLAWGRGISGIAVQWQDPQPSTNKMRMSTGSSAHALPSKAAPHRP